MKSRQSLKSSVKLAFLYSLLASTLIAGGCSNPPSATYDRSNIEDAVRQIGLNDYDLTLQARLVDRTLWIYMPLDTLLEENAAKKPSDPQPKPRLFFIKENNVDFTDGILNVSHLIQPPPPDEQGPGLQYNKESSAKINKLWRILRRVVFSMKPDPVNGVRFLCVVTADIVQGYYLNDIVYADDLKKVSYGFISIEELQHRIVQDSRKSDLLIGDKNGDHVNYRDISMEEFIAGQIHDRIQVKFTKPEVPKNADIDKEIIKTVEYTLQIYNYYNFDALELFNAQSQRKILLSPAALRNYATD